LCRKMYAIWSGKSGHLAETDELPVSSDVWESWTLMTGDTGV
jgi:hypothetical protein